jgi:hypothetical protein
LWGEKQELTDFLVFQDGKKGVEVTGSAAGVKDCVDAINAKIGGGRPPRKSKESLDIVDSLSKFSRFPTAFDDDDDSEKVTEKFTVESSKCGRIVGPGGSVIKELQDEFNVKINLDREVDDVS